MSLRIAVIRNSKTPLSTVQRYLPHNYEADEPEAGTILIYGTDNAGWTLDGYVIPRLASGNMYAKELLDEDAGTLPKLLKGKN